MSKYKRPFGVIAGPLVVVLAVAGYWGVQSAMSMKTQVEGWAYEFEHTSSPVMMEMPDIPMIPPLFVNGDRIGRVETVVLMRDEAASLDSVAVVASVEGHFLEALEGCALRLRVRSFDLEDYSSALRCTRNVENLMPFGHLTIEGTDITVPIMIRRSELENNISIELSRELETLQHSLESERHQMEMEMGEAARELKHELEQVRVEVRRAVKVGGR
jgi:hypothetical protein